MKDDGQGNASVEWSSEFNPEGATEKEATEIIAGIYQAGLDNLYKIFSS